MANGYAALRKQELRERTARRRDSATEKDRIQWSEAICERTIGGWGERFARWRDDGLVLGLFVPFRSEADVMGIARWCWERDVPVAAPILEKRDMSMAFHRIAGDRDLRSGAYGIREPKRETPRVAESQLAALLIPGLAFDAEGGRLGYGGGYYDRFLDRLRANGHAPQLLAPAFELQLVDKVPMDPHDTRVHFLVTEARTVTCGKEAGSNC